MKKLFILFLLLISAVAYVNAQQGDPQQGYHEHDGFYLSMCLGPVFGPITDDLGSYTMDFSGVGAQFDFKIGGRISQNLLLHATLVSSAVSGPKVTYSNNTTYQASNDMTLGEATLGVGLTYYIMPSNIFFSGSLGIGNFSIQDVNNHTNITTHMGFSMQLKVGKEWWVGKNWGLGVGITYGKTNLTNNSGGISEKLDSNRIGILFNTTFN
jgi:hypothetical protein